MTEKNSSWQDKMGKSNKNADNSDENVNNETDIEGNDNNSDENVNNLSETEVLQQKLQESEVKIRDLNNKLLRSLAESENVRRRSREEIEKTSNFAISGFASDLVVVAENFFLACDNMPKEDESTSNEVKSLILAVKMTKNELIKTLEKNKVKRVFSLNEQFDHNIHEAVSHVQSDKPEGEVIQVVQAGYLLGSRIIRPSLVVVSKGE